MTMYIDTKAFVAIHKMIIIITGLLNRSKYRENEKNSYHNNLLL